MPKKNETRSRNYLVVEKFRRGNRQFVGVFRRRAKQKWNGKDWETYETKRLGIKSYKPVRFYKSIARKVRIGKKNWSFSRALQGFARKINSKKKVQMLRVRVAGVHGGKRRSFTAYVRFSPRGKGYLLRSGRAQQEEYIANVLARTALSKIRSLGYSSSPESKRNLEVGDKKSNSRFFAQSIRVDSVR